MINKEQFKKILEKVIEHNGYTKSMLTSKQCDMQGLWTPCDMILREYYNNGGGSANGFLGITMEECIDAFYFIKENVEFFKSNDLISPKGYNNFGWLLWTNYNIA